MIGGAPFLGLGQRLDGKSHKEYAAAMSKFQQQQQKPYPVAYTCEDGGKWNTPKAVKFSDGTVYDNVIHKWRKSTDDMVEQWNTVCRHEPLASARMTAAGDALANEVRALRAKLLDLEMEKRGMPDDDERDF